MLKFISFSGKTIDKLSKQDAHAFLTNLSERKVTGNTMNVYHMAIRFFLEDILHKNMKLNIKYSKRPTKLPEVLTKDEILKILESIKNSKHKLMISLLYGAGLRLGELINLKVRDINFENKYGFVRPGKGNKDRIFILPEKISYGIQELIKNENLSLEDYVFISNKKEKYSPRTIAEIIKTASKISGIAPYKKIHPHTLRHSSATHLIENGNSLNEVQALLGHKSPETTRVYVHLARPNMINIKSPLDRF